ncbi:Uncharacterised protein [Burkholderia pseudomallei]|nr:Uncharacterised protein [Burkholderia pseudomallei]CAJ9873882.1 Uncharacterised protein [Burkholderia pseudomallei]CFV92588.1 Uncharacterised protein [Burkholderia pseudomallei]CPG43346.1 Uncharacterised protein [Burkholderia pseudomallei]
MERRWSADGTPVAECVCGCVACRVRTSGFAGLRRQWRQCGMSACRHVGGATGGALRCPVLRGAARDRGSGDAARPASAARIESRATGGSCAIAPNRGDIRDADREGAWRKKRGGARLSSWKAGRLEGWKAGRREGWKAGRLEGGKAGRREGGKAGRREGGKAWDGVRPFAPSYVVVHRDEGRGAHYRRGRWQRPGSSRVNRRRALGGFGFGFGCVGTACVRLKRVTCPHPAACRARSPMRWGRRAPSAERRAPRGSCSNPARTRISSRASGARRAGRSRPRCDAARRMRAACSAPPFTCGRGTARCRCA